MMAEGWEDLPEECQEAILDRIRTTAEEDHQLEPLSLVSKSFLSFSNGVRSTLNISDRTLLLAPEGDISPLFRRFHQLKRISFAGLHGDLDSAIECLYRSDLKLEALDLSGQKHFPYDFRKLGKKMEGTMKTLICANIPNLSYFELAHITSALPGLEELDVSYCSYISDDEIKRLSSDLPKLRSINLSGINLLTDASMEYLSKNCPLLSRISVRDCEYITVKGVDRVIRNCPNLSSLSANENILYYYSHDDDQCMLDLSPATALQSLELCRIILPFGQIVSYYSPDGVLGMRKVSPLSTSWTLGGLLTDELVFPTGKLPLRKLVLSHCRGFSFAGVSTLLCKCDSLRHLDLEGMGFLTDGMISSLSKHFRCLISVGLNLCSRLTSLTFFNLVKNCPLLEEMRMENTSLGEDDLTSSNLGENHAIRSLKLASNEYLCDETLERMGLVCPELRLLDVSHCPRITGIGIGLIGKRCTEITELRIDGCEQVRNLGPDSEFLKLDVLVASKLGIGHEGLGMIGRGCPRLRVLDLSGCLGVTEEGLKELVKSDVCRNSLRRLNLNNCCNVSVDCLAWMVFLGTSLRTIISPFVAISNPFPTKNLRDLFLRHGCLVTSECKEQVDRFSGALYKGFETEEEAEKSSRSYCSGLGNSSQRSNSTGLVHILVCLVCIVVVVVLALFYLAI